MAAARTIGQVLWDDLAFEREFSLIPRDTYQSIPAARSLADVPFDRWRELGADGLVIGTVERSGKDFRVVMRLYQVSTRQTAFGPKEYVGPAANPRLFAHTIADEIHQNQVALRGVARTKLAFATDRDGERVGDTVEERSVKEIYIADYDGANQRRVTTNRRLNITPSWSPDGRAIAYTSYRRGFPDIFISIIYQGTLENPTKGQGHNYLPVWSPDGTRLAFMSNRDGNAEIYVMNRDGSGLRRLTNHPAIDVTPTWSPTGTQIAFTSDRSGSPQIYIVGVDGLGLQQVTRESVLRPPDLVAGAVQRDRLRLADGPRLRHQDHRHVLARDPAGHLRRGQQREPGVRAQRPAPRLHVHAQRQAADLDDFAAGEGPAADYAGGQQRHARLVEVRRIT